MVIRAFIAFVNVDVDVENINIIIIVLIVGLMASKINGKN